MQIMKWPIDGPVIMMSQTRKIKNIISASVHINEVDRGRGDGANTTAATIPSFVR